MNQSCGCGRSLPQSLVTFLWCPEMTVQRGSSWSESPGLHVAGGWPVLRVYPAGPEDRKQVPLSLEPESPDMALSPLGDHAVKPEVLRHTHYVLRGELPSASPRVGGRSHLGCPNPHPPRPRTSRRAPSARGQDPLILCLERRAQCCGGCTSGSLLGFRTPTHASPTFLPGFGSCVTSASKHATGRTGGS